MKKNLMSVIILALCLVNLILNALIVFVCVPSNKKVNKLVTDIASVLNLELEGADEPKVKVEDIATFTSSENITVKLKADGSTNADGSPLVRYAQVGITISMDSSSKEFANINSLISSSEGLINDVIMNVVSNYTAAEIDTPEIKEAIKKEILEKLQKKFGSTCIFSIDFKSLITT